MGHARFSYRQIFCGRKPAQPYWLYNWIARKCSRFETIDLKDEESVKSCITVSVSPQVEVEDEIARVYFHHSFTADPFSLSFINKQAPVDIFWHFNNCQNTKAPVVKWKIAFWMNNQKGLTPGAHYLIPIRLWINGLKWAKAWWRLCQHYHKPRVLKISFISAQCYQSPRASSSNTVILILLLWNSHRLSIFPPESVKLLPSTLCQS